MKKEKFTLYNKTQKIYGFAFLSDIAGGQAPAIIMSHGYLSNLGNFEYFAERFCQNGYNVYTFNFRCGSDEQSPELRSEGRSEDMCIEGEIEDLLKVYEYVANQEGVKKDEVYLWGESQGALVCGLTAARLQEKIKKLIMIFPAVCIPDHARRGILGGASYDPKNPPETMSAPMATLGKAFHDGVKDMDVYSELAKYRGETLLIQGSKDSIVVPEYQYIVKDWFDKTDSPIVPSMVPGTIDGPRDDGKKRAMVPGTMENHRLKLQMVRGMDHWTGGEHKESLAEAIEYFINGKVEIFSFRIIVTDVVALDENDKIEFNGLAESEIPVHEQDVYFTGYCESNLFTGCITEGVDHQAYIGHECVKMSAIYTFLGVDGKGEKCKMQVCNNRSGDTWKPKIQTDSKELSWLNGADLTAVVEPGDLGPTIRIYK